MEENSLSDIINLITEIEKNPDYLCRITKDNSDFEKLIWKRFLEIYNKRPNLSGDNVLKGEELNELFQNNAIDEEALWHLIELINNETNKTFNIPISLEKNELLPIKIDDNSDSPIENSSDNDDKKDDSDKLQDKDNDDDSDELQYESSDDEENVESKNNKIRENDRDFFDEKEMMKFLDKSESGEKPNDSDIDYFDDMSDDNSESSGAKYSDFFEEDESAGDELNKKKYSENDSEDEGSGDSDLDEEVLDEEDNSDHIKSSFQIKQEKLRYKINKLEEEALKEKPWPLKGEIEASQRPVNSLLEEIVEIDLAQRPAPVITKEVTMKLEDIILKRIKDKAYDDVEKKIKPIEGPHEFKKAIILDQEKSKFSLAEIYEKEFLKQKNEQIIDISGEEKLTAVEEEIIKSMQSLFKKLDTLTNFHFVPKPAVADVKIITNQPAIMLEEVAPIATAKDNTLAPEEISSMSKRQLISKDEKETTDKNRERRKKKKLQRLRAKRGQKLANTSVKSSIKNRQDKTANDISIKTSKSFFTKFQEQQETSSSIKKRKLEKISDKNKELQVKKLKL